VVISARVLQGITGSAISPNATAMLRSITDEETRGRSFGIFDMFISASAAVGPFIGGLLVGGFGWRSMFLLAAPVARPSRALVTRMIAADHGEHSVAPRRGGMLSALKALRAMPFAAAVAGVLGATVVLHGLTVTVPIFTQTLLGASPQITGVLMLPMFAVSSLLAPIGGRLSDRLGRRLPAMAGSLIMAAGLASLWLGTSSLTALAVAVFLGLVGIGFGSSGPARQTSAIESIPPEVTGTAASLYLTSRYIGGVLGASLVGILLGERATFHSAGRAFGSLCLVAVAVTVVSAGLAGRRLKPDAQQIAGYQEQAGE
ncbi:MAG: MFS transporter, partial [Acidimicrobiia bacterium]